VIYNILRKWLFLSSCGFIHEMIFFLEFLNKYFLFMDASHYHVIITFIIDYLELSYLLIYLWLYMIIYV